MANDDAGSLTSFAEGIWLDTGPSHFLGMRLTATMTVLRLRDQSLLLYSPVALTAERRAAVEALGTVAHLYAPNLFHHLRIGEWAEAFPLARVHAPKELGKKRPDLRIDRTHNEAAPEPAFEGIVDEVVVRGCRLRETVLFYRPAKTLVVADLVHNIGRPEHWWTKFYTRMAGFYDRVAVSSVIKSTAFDDKAAARRSVDAVLALPFERVIVGHGAAIEAGARDAVAGAYGWLAAVSG